MTSLNEIVEDFAKGKDRATYSQNIFAEHGSLYSYGTHFTLAIREPEETNLKDGKAWYLLNGDRYSVSTSRHQSYTFSALRNEPRVSFTALREAGIRPKQVCLVDFTPDYQDFWSKHDQESTEVWLKNQPVGASLSRHYDHEGNLSGISAHRVGSAVLRTGSQGSYRHYLCSMDEDSYFISELVLPVTSVEQAFEDLKPANVLLAELEGKEVKRQGEWFFIKTSREELKAVNILIKDFVTKCYTLPKSDSFSNGHVVTKVATDGTNVFCRGTVRHIDNWGHPTGEHRMLKLGKDTYTATMNTAIASWSAGGSVD